MLSNIAFVLGGCLAGVFTGLVPGIHINTVALFLLLFAGQQNLGLALFIVSLAITHSFVDFIPSVVLGAPSEDNFLALLPGHRLLLEGKGFQAVQLTVVGGLLAVLVSLPLIPFYGFFVLQLKEVIVFFIPAILSGIVWLMVFSEKTLRQRLWALAVICLAGALGLIVLRSELGITNGLFVAITGLFGASNLIFALRQKPLIPKQSPTPQNFGVLKSLDAAFSSAIAGLLVSFLPGIGANQAAFLIKKFKGRLAPERFLMVLGGINTANLLFSFFALYFLGKTRTGAAAAVKELIPLSLEHLLLFTAVIVFAAGFAALAAIFLAKNILKVVQRIDYFKINLLVLCFLFLLAFFLSNNLGFLVFLTATCIGLIPIAQGVKRTHAMAFLMVPTIAYYLGL